MSTLPTQGSQTVEALVSFLAQQVSQLPNGARYILGIVGYPGAGKSTVSEWLVSGVNEKLAEQPAMVVPMDGYHYSNEKLEEIGLLPLKGIPDTFDSLAFIELLKKLRTVTDTKVYCPLFDRSIEASIPDAIVIEPKHKLCVVEGNYLLYEKKPWDECKNYFDEVWFLDVSFDTILPRLQERHEAGGRTVEGAKAKVESTDLPNARLVDATKHRAHRILDIVSEPVVVASS
jgi:pantothenate kinase